MKGLLIQIIILILFVSACKTTKAPLTDNENMKAEITKVEEVFEIAIIKDTVETLPGLFDIKYYDAQSGELLFIHKNYNSQNLSINFVEIYNTSQAVIQHLPPNTHYIISTKP